MKRVEASAAFTVRRILDLKLNSIIFIGSMLESFDDTISHGNLKQRCGRVRTKPIVRYGSARLLDHPIAGPLVAICEPILKTDSTARWGMPGMQRDVEIFPRSRPAHGGPSNLEACC